MTVKELKEQLASYEDDRLVGISKGSKKMYGMYLYPAENLDGEKWLILEPAGKKVTGYIDHEGRF